MFTNLFLSSLVIAGLAVLWRNSLHDFPSINDALKRSRFLGKAITCGFCFTYWVALIFALLFDPLYGWVPPIRIAISPVLFFILKIFFSWMAIGIMAVIIRFAYVVLQEHVHWQVHTLNKHPEHRH